MRSVNPATKQLIREYPEDSRETVGLKIDQAARAFPEWRARGFAERASLMMRVADRLRDERERHARLITDEMGKLTREALAEVDKCAWLAAFYAEHAGRFLADEATPSDASESYVRFDPLGVILGVMPWNFPYWQALRFAVPALMAGNVILLKHASNVSGCALALEKLFRDSGFPTGAFTTLLVRGSHVDGLIRDPRVAGVSVTGSTRTGRAVAKAAGESVKRSVLELGGSDPFVVLADADLDVAAFEAVAARMINAGQSCIAAKRFIVEAPVHDAFVQRFREQLAGLVIGDPAAELSEVGPLARGDLLDALHRQVQTSIKMGARCELGGRPAPGPGFYYEPTLLTGVTPGMPVFDEETFGPVAAVVAADDVEHAITLANSSVYGLGASVWTTAERGKELAARLDAGHVAVNGVVKSDPRLPFGGVKASGYGRELSRFGILEFVDIKAVWVR